MFSATLKLPSLRTLKDEQTVKILTNYLTIVESPIRKKILPPPNPGRKIFLWSILERLGKTEQHGFFSGKKTAQPPEIFLLPVSLGNQGLMFTEKS